MMRALPILPALLVLALGAGPAQAQQGLFSPRIIINDRAVTQFELDQRIAMLDLFRTPGDLEAEALKVLTEERLYLFAADQLQLEVTDEQIRDGMAEFATRAQLSTEQFLQGLAEGGVAEATFRDFVRAGLLWREVVRARFAPLVSISEAEIDRALQNEVDRTRLRFLLSELILAAPPGQEAATLARAEELRSLILAGDDFGAVARQLSAAATAPNGGQLEWLPAANLPPNLVPILMTMQPGELTDPVVLPGAVAVFQLRAMDDRGPGAANGATVDYIQFLIPEGPDTAAELAALRARVLSCRDLYPLARGLPEDRLIVTEDQPMGAVPRDIALELARLDANEISTTLLRGNARVVLMLCARTPVRDPEPTRDQVRERLLNQKIGAMADRYLEELRADAIIRTP
ncbi:MAG TPA: peptidylprolyl isomerase [Paracoccaceae bacterium]|nr:peptidylprolyl isomerase [Paracoccaceae bacterium]